MASWPPSGPCVAEGASTEDLEDARWLVVDVETTGLNATVDLITELAGILVEGDRRSVAATATCPSDVPAAINDLAAVIDARTILVAHNLAFDLAFLRAAGAPPGLGWPESWLCTYRAGSRAETLSQLATRYAVTIDGAHTALGDASALAEVLAHAVRRVMSGAHARLGVSDLIIEIAGGEWPADRCAPDGALVVRDRLDHVVPVPLLTNDQRAVLRRVIHDARASARWPVEHDDLVGQLRSVGIVREHFDLISRELRESPRDT